MRDLRAAALPQDLAGLVQRHHRGHRPRLPGRDGGQGGGPGGERQGRRHPARLMSLGSGERLPGGPHRGGAGGARAVPGGGGRPLVRSRWIGPRLGLRGLYFKLEQTNPSGSFKDRFAARLVSGMLARGQSLCVGTSSGNTGRRVAAVHRRGGAALRPLRPGGGPCGQAGAGPGLRGPSAAGAGDAGHPGGPAPAPGPPAGAWPGARGCPWASPPTPAPRRRWPGSSPWAGS